MTGQRMTETHLSRVCHSGGARQALTTILRSPRRTNREDKK